MLQFLGQQCSIIQYFDQGIAAFPAHYIKVCFYEPLVFLVAHDEQEDKTWVYRDYSSLVFFFFLLWSYKQAFTISQLHLLH